jgi:tRNA modification GTPase
VLWLVDAANQGIERDGAAPVWVVRSKIDLDAAGQSAVPEFGQLRVAFKISSSRGDGIPELISALVAFAQDYFGTGEGGLIGRTRQRQLLQGTALSLQRSIEVIGTGEELAAEDLRAAAHSLGRLLGRVDVEDILDVIFREFCIGK